VSEPEGTGTSNRSENRSRIHSFLTSAPALIGSFATLITAIAGLLIAWNQLSGDDGGGSASATATDVAPSPPPPAGQTATSTGAAELFGDATFRDEANEEYGRVSIDESGAMYVEVERTRPIIHIANEPPREDVRLSVRARRQGGTTGYAVGLICRHASPGNYYLLAILIGPDTRMYDIVKYVDRKPRSLIGGRTESPEIEADENTVTATCQGDPAELTLTVNGRALPPVVDRDDPEQAGRVGVRVGTGFPPATVRLDEFDLDSL
jgi:hypothetical protein